jgi:hypothetical protein
VSSTCYIEIHVNICKNVQDSWFLYFKCGFMNEVGKINILGLKLVITWVT